MADEQLKAPYQYFGGKAKVAKDVWDRFGDVPSYIEPFAGSLAVMLGRPYQGQQTFSEIVNDKDCFVTNFWRATQADADTVCKFADQPVHELELKARNDYLMKHPLREKMIEDPKYYDAEAAGWWVWGLCAWAIQGWCEKDVAREHPLPEVGTHGKGVHSLGQRQDLPLVFKRLQQRLRYVRVLCGDWQRPLSDSITGYGKGPRPNMTPVGIFLDPPYDSGSVEYNAGGNGIAQDVCKWALEHGQSKDMRICLAGYDGDYVMPKDWEVLAWNAGPGFSRKENKKERLWFSPHCLKANGRQAIKNVMDLFQAG